MPGTSLRHSFTSVLALAESAETCLAKRVALEGGLGPSCLLENTLDLYEVKCSNVQDYLSPLAMHMWLVNERGVDHASHTIALVLIDKLPSCNINAWKICPSCSHANNTYSDGGHGIFPRVLALEGTACQ